MEIIIHAQCQGNVDSISLHAAPSSKTPNSLCIIHPHYDRLTNLEQKMSYWTQQAPFEIKMPKHVSLFCKDGRIEITPYFHEAALNVEIQIILHSKALLPGDIPTNLCFLQSPVHQASPVLLNFANIMGIWLEIKLHLASPTHFALVQTFPVPRELALWSFSLSVIHTATQLCKTCTVGTGKLSSASVSKRSDPRLGSKYLYFKEYKLEVREESAFYLAVKELVPISKEKSYVLICTKSHQQTKKNKWIKPSNVSCLQRNLQSMSHTLLII